MSITILHPERDMGYGAERFDAEDTYESTRSV